VLEKVQYFTGGYCFALLQNHSSHSLDGRRKENSLIFHFRTSFLTFSRTSFFLLNLSVPIKDIGDGIMIRSLRLIVIP
jgi:hypothetical protein